METIDIGSIDTGRGSSIASSPPEYFPDSPLEDVKNKVKMVDSGTSPRRRETTNTAVSPILFELLTPMTKPEIGYADNSTNHKIMVDKAVSPRKSTDSLKLEKSANDEANHNDKIAKGLLHEDNNDWEIELILSNMRLEHSLITPMPSSPSRLSDTESRSLSTILGSCEDEDFAKLQYDNKKLQSNMVLIKREMMRLKRFIQCMDLNDEFNKFMNVSLINEINAIENSVIPVISIDNGDNIALDLDDDEDHATGVMPPVNNDNVLLVEPDKAQLKNVTEDQGSLNVESTENDKISSCKDCEANQTMAKARKLSKLDKLRKRMLPKSKIRRLVGPPKRLLDSMTKRLSPCNRSSPVLSRQDAYAKAVLIWKQLSSKKKVTHDKDNAKLSVNKKTKQPKIEKEDENKTQPKNEQSPNKFENQNDFPLQTQINKSRKNSETTKQSYGIKTRKSSVSLPDSPPAGHKNSNSLDSDKDLYVVFELSLSEKIQMLQKDVNILNTVNNTVKSSIDAKSPKVHPAAETEKQSKRILHSSLTTQTNEDNANKSKTDNVVLHSDVKSPPKNEPENLKPQTRRSLIRASQVSRENSDEEIILNNNEKSNENVTPRERRRQRKLLNETQIKYKRILRSSNQPPDSPNSPESQKQGISVDVTDTKKHAILSQRQGNQTTFTDNNLVCSVTNRNRSSIQQSDKNAFLGDCDKIDNDPSPLKRKGRKRKCQDVPEIQSKRTLRSSAVVQPSTINDNMEANLSSATCNEMLHTDKPKSLINDTEKENNTNLRYNKQHSNAKTNGDNTTDNKHINNNGKQTHGNEIGGSHTSVIDNRRNSVLCKGIEKYGFNHEKTPMKKLPGIYFLYYLLLLFELYVVSCITILLCFQMLYPTQSVRNWKIASHRLLNYP